MAIHSIRRSASASKAVWLRRFAWAAPLFFFAKGLLWLLAPLVIAWYGLE